MRYQLICNKNGISTVIATVLLVLISIIAISIIAAVIIPFIEDKFQQVSCIDLLDNVEIDEQSGYTCFNESSGETSVMIYIGDIEINKLIVSLTVGPNSDSYTIEQSAQIPGVKMYGETYGGNLRLPGKNGARTYVFNLKADRVRVTPVVGEQMCDVVESQELSRCN